MRYFIIAGEASGDIHGAALIASLREQDPQAEFKFLGGDKMAAAAATAPLVHYRDMAFMGFIEVAKHLGSILGFMDLARRTIEQWCPQAVILIDYPSFNLKIARYAHSQNIPVFYFISPKVWVWKEYRVRDIKRYVTRLYSILPFETEFYARHDYKVDYVGNPTVTEIAEAASQFHPFADFCCQHDLEQDMPIVAIVPGSRAKEIRDNLPTMIQAAQQASGHQIVIAGAPSIQQSLYDEILSQLSVKIPVLMNTTFELVHHAQAALVTSGTATLETALLGTPQVVCYRMNGSKFIYRFYRRLLKGKYVSLPNLITDDTVIPELLLHYCSVENVAEHLIPLLSDTPQRQVMLRGYQHMAELLGTKNCTETTARNIIDHLNATR